MVAKRKDIVASTILVLIAAAFLYFDPGGYIPFGLSRPGVIFLLSTLYLAQWIIFIKTERAKRTIETDDRRSEEKI